jgi:antitoxin MazE
MKSRVQKWGNSLALRIPKTFAAEAGFEKESSVDISLEKGKLVVTPVTKPEYSLEQLLDAVTPENLHPEIETGPAAGNERW